MTNDPNPHEFNGSQEPTRSQEAPPKQEAPTTNIVSAPAGPEASFAMVACANGAEGVIKNDLQESGWRLAFSRPGFVTVKHDSARRSPPTHPLIRTSMVSLGAVRGDEWEKLAGPIMEKLGELPSDRQFDHVHIFPRDRVPVGKFDFEPGIDPLCEMVGEKLHQAIVGVSDSRPQPLVRSRTFNEVAEPMQSVLDVVLVEPGDWWFGYHRAIDLHGRWPGGVQPIEPEYPPVSRAYYKAAEGLAWAEFDWKPGDTAVEIGSAPGGACGRLLELGMNVIGIDPADMDHRIARHTRFKHYKARGGDLPRRVYADAKWLLVDSNVRPDQTLSTIENIVNHESCQLRGLLITLKLGRYEHLDRIDRWVERVNSWRGVTSPVLVKQLSRNKIEVTLRVLRESRS